MSSNSIKPEDLMRDADCAIISEKIENIMNYAREQALKDAERDGISVNCEDWNYWRIYAKDIDENSIGLNLAEMHLLQKYLDDNIKNERSSSLFYSRMMDELHSFCHNCKQECCDCAISELKASVSRKI